MIETNVRARRAAAHPASAALIPTKQRIDQLADRFGKRLVIICSFCLVPDELPGRPDLTPCLGMHLFISQSIGRVGTMLQEGVKGIVQAKRRHPQKAQKPSAPKPPSRLVVDSHAVMHCSFLCRYRTITPGLFEVECLRSLPRRWSDNSTRRVNTSIWSVR